MGCGAFWYTVYIHHHSFSGLPEGFNSPNYKPPTEVPCIISLLCEKHEGLVIEAKGIKEHWWKPYIKKLVDKKVSADVSMLLYNPIWEKERNMKSAGLWSESNKMLQCGK